MPALAIVNGGGWELNVYTSNGKQGGSVAVECPKPRGREGRFGTPQSQIVVCPWAKKSFLAYFDKVLFCQTAVRLMPDNCSVSGLRHHPPSSQSSQWKCKEINVKLAHMQPSYKPIQGWVGNGCN